MKVAVVGTGGWGTALAVLLQANGHQVTLWGRMVQEVDPIRRDGENKLLLPGVAVAAAIDVTTDDLALRGADLALLAVPSHGMRPICERLRPVLAPETLLVHVAKGIENDTGLRMSEVIRQTLGSRPVGVLSGPSHAEEVGRGVPTAVVVAAAEASLARTTQEVFRNERFRVYTHDDVIGVELGGAMKNVIALAAGVCDGIGFGDNSKAALCTRGLAEMGRLGLAVGARRETFFGLSGVGDLMVTAFSRHSRNRSFGERLGKGERREQIEASTPTVAEGVRTTRAAWQLAQRLGVELPITRELYAALYQGKSPRQAVRDLMARQAKPEFDS